MNEHPVRPAVGRNVYIAPTSYVGGDVTIGDDSTIMHHVMVRGDVSRIYIGRRVNVQDGGIVHTKNGVDLHVGDDVAIGHRAVVHCKSVGSGTLIGTGAIVLDDCEIGRGCIIAAGSVLPPGTIIPDGKMVMGVPGRIVRDTTDDERAYIRYVVENYRRLGRLHARGVYPAAISTATD